MSLEALGRMGRREIAYGRLGKLPLLLSAGGAGLITTLTVVMKIRLLDPSFTLFQRGAFGAVNFVASFLCMQAFGFRLATKQSPLLGATVGRTLQRLRKGACRSVLRRELGQSLTTQALSAAGNLLFVLVGALLFHGVFLSRNGSVYLDSASARMALASLHPWHSHTLAYAALTGAALWLCALLSARLAQKLPPFSRTLSSVLFNISLGVLLAMTPVVGKLIGRPLDVRHFTLSGGLLALATASLGFREAWHAGLPAALLGVTAIGALNFSVSFVLAALASRHGPDGASPPPAAPDATPAVQALTLSSFRRIFPTGVLGRSLRNSTCLGTL